MIRRVATATAAIVRNLYHATRLCPTCRAGARWLPLTRRHVGATNVRLAIGTLPRRRT